MRIRHFAYVALLALVAGCSGAYDRELLGDPEPVAYTPPTQTQAQDDWTAGADDMDSTDAEPITFTPDNYDMFQDLGPYGQWYQTDAFGDVWCPAVPVGWQPYSRGHWIWTSYGWMWASYDPFGWATYHYGTWWYDAVLGWMWIPDYNWMPCPVNWIVTDNYYGWCPYAPPGHEWNDPWNEPGRYKDPWVVVPKAKFKEVDVGEANVPPTKFKSDYRAGNVVRTAPETRMVERTTRQPIKQTDIEINTKQYGQHELRKVVLPGREQNIVNRFPMTGGTTKQPITTNPVVTPRVAPVNPPSGGGGGQSGNVTPPPAKSKSPSNPPPSNNAPEKFKSRDKKGSSDSKGKDDSGKDDGKSKGGNSDDGKSKGGSSQPAKAKGGKK